MPRIVGYHDSPFHRLTALAYYKVSDSLRGAPDCYHIHPVCAGTYFATKAGSSEAQILVKSVANFLFVSYLYKLFIEFSIL